MNFHIVNVVWGRSFVDAYLKVSLPLQLCAGNIGAFPSQSARYRMFTTQEDWEYMQTFPIMRKLQEMIPVDFIEISLFKGLNSIENMNKSHNRAIQDAARNQAALIFLSPDCLISNQTFKTIVNEAEKGKRVIMVLSMRLQKEKIVPLIESFLQEKTIASQGIESRQLIDLSLPHLHLISQSYMWERGGQITQNCGHLYWKLDEKNLLARGFHLHPIFVWPEKPQAVSGVSIDDQFVWLACPSKDRWKVIRDSDEMAIFEITDHFREKDVRWMPCKPLYVASWASYFAGAHHLWLLRKPIHIHAADWNLKWEGIEKESDVIAQQILSLCENKNMFVGMCMHFSMIKLRFKRITFKKLLKFIYRKIKFCQTSFLTRNVW